MSEIELFDEFFEAFCVTLKKATVHLIVMSSFFIRTLLLYLFFTAC